MMKCIDRSIPAIAEIAVVSGLMIGFGAALPASAQTTAATGQGTLQEVVVSARRELESVQDIPTSITALSPKDLEQNQLTSTQDIAEITPNLHIDVGSRAVNAELSIRGIVPQGSAGDATTNPTVGEYINGVYVGARLANVMSTLDIQRIEVLRGPQGTLFGKNTTAGAINIVTNRPNDRLEGEALIRTGSHNRQDAHLIVNTPFSDTLFGRIAVGQDKQDGYYHNLNLNTDTSDRNVKTYIASLRWKPNDALTFDASFSHMDQNEHNIGGTCIYVPGNGPVSFQRVYNHYAALQGLPDFQTACLQSQNAGRYNYYADAQAYDRVNVDSGTFEAAWEAGNVGFIENFGANLSLGQRTWGYAFLVDSDMTVAREETRGNNFGTDNFPQHGTSVTGELIFHGKIGLADIVTGWNHVEVMGRQGSGRSQCFDKYQAVFGTGQSVLCNGNGFYFGNDPLNVDPAQGGATPFVSNDQGRSRSDGYFAHVKWQFTDWFRLETGIRYTREFKDFWDIEGDVTPTSDFGGYQFIMNDSTVSLFGTGSAIFSKTTPAVSLNFQLPQGVGMVDEGLVYLLWSRGFQSGGFNEELPLAQVPALKPLQVFRPETLDNYEVGIKTTLLDHHLRVNLAVFDMKYKDKQEAINIDNSDGQYGSNPAIEVTQNAAKADVKGYELEFQTRLPFGFGLDGGLAVQKPKYTDYTVFDPTSGNLVDLTKKPLNSLPKTTFTGNVTWGTTLPNASSLDFRVGGYYQSAIDRGVTTADQIQSGARTLCYQPAYTTTNARVGWTDSSDRVTVALSGRNLGNTVVMNGCTLQDTARNAFHPIYADERTWALEAMYRFHG